MSNAKRDRLAEGHVCEYPDTCCCSISALEPDDDCPIHSFGPPIDRCKHCGRFMRKNRKALEGAE